MADDLRFPPLSAILGDSAVQSESAVEPDTPKKHVRKQSRETKKTPFPPRKAPTLEEPKDANAVKPKQTKSRNGTSTHTNARITPAHAHTNMPASCINMSASRRFHSAPTLFSFPFFVHQLTYIYAEGIADLTPGQDV